LYGHKNPSDGYKSPNIQAHIFNVAAASLDFKRLRYQANAKLPYTRLLNTLVSRNSS